MMGHSIVKGIEIRPSLPSACPILQGLYQDDFHNAGVFAGYAYVWHAGKRG
jgi:hypothetical protein